MNTFTAKKIGEVRAFADIAVETIDKASVVFESIYGEDTASLRDQFRSISENLLATVSDHEMKDVVAEKTAKTSDKIRAMQSLYLATPEDWANPIEILEWSSFFYGAGFTHSELVRGAAEVLGNEELATLALESTEIHHELLDHASTHLNEYGATRAKE